MRFKIVGRWKKPKSAKQPQFPRFELLVVIPWIGNELNCQSDNETACTAWFERTSTSSISRAESGL